MRAPWWFIGSAALVLLACSRRDRAGERVAQDSSGAPPPASSGAQTSGAPPDGVQRPDSVRGWVVGFEGIGPLRIGMTKAEARAALGPELAWPDKPDESCDYASVRRAGVNIGLMISRGRIARVDVRTPSITTAAGARVGDLEARIRQLYGADLRTEPHKYQDGHYLIIPAPGDPTRRLIFETNRDTVTTYRVGTRPAVDWVEGCS